MEIEEEGLQEDEQYRNSLHMGETNAQRTPDVTLLGHFSFLLPFISVLLLHLSHACVAPRPLGLASSLLIAPVLLFSWR